jgi:hypothetical protein
MEDRFTLKVVDEQDAGAFTNDAVLPLLNLVADVLDAIIVDDPHITLIGSQDRKGIYIEFDFSDKDTSCPLFIGRRFRTVNALLELVRFQQVLPHNRYIEFRMKRPDGTMQRIFNRRVFSREPTEVEKLVDMLNNMKISTNPKQQLEDLNNVLDATETAIEALSQEEAA